MSTIRLGIPIILLATMGAFGIIAVRAGGRGAPATPHTPNAAQDARFGAQYNYNTPSPLAPVTAFPDKASWEKRAEFLQHQVLVANGLWPMPQKTPLNPVIHGKTEKDDFTIEKVFFQSTPGHYVTGSLYRPKNIPPGAKIPAILAPYGHWGTAPNNGRFWWRTDAEIQTELSSGGERSADAARSPLQETCMNLAHMGCVVFEWDLVGFCDSSVIKHQEGFTDTAAVLRLQSFMGLQTWNGIRALDFVLSLPEVDPARVCVTGSSGGATQTMQLGATDPRLAATFAIVMVDVHMQGGCICENAPLLRVGTNNAEIASLSAPRPQGDAGASNDNSRDFETNGFPFMHHVYDLLGAPKAAEAFTVQAGHNHNVHSRELLYSFVNRTFKLGLAEPIAEKPFTPVPVAQLSVWDADHKLPPDFVDAKTLRERMTKASDDQMAALEKNPAEYRATLKTALQAMVDDTLPAPKDVEIKQDEAVVAGNIQRGFLARNGAGERIPFALLKPEKPSGTTLIYADPKGISALLADGKPTPQAATLLAAGAQILVIDQFMSDAFKRPTPLPNPAGMRSNYSAYANGYERTILANRVHDLLTAMAAARRLDETTRLRIVGTGDAGIPALLAAALAGDTVERAAIDLAGFDFDQVTDDRNPNLLPGALKYGGIYAFATLRAGTNQKTLLTGARETGQFPLASRTDTLILEKSPRSPDDLAAWALH